MKKTKFLFAVLLLFTLSSCANREGAMKSEKGVVIEKQFYPATSAVASGTGFNSSGDVTFSTHTISSEERFCIVFKCQHGVVFSINRDTLYSELEKGDSVTIFYYNLAYFFSKNPAGYDFVSAKKTERPVFNTNNFKP
jgi:hypothetical protein